MRYPRWMLELPEAVDEVFITYIGVQPRSQQTPPKGVFTNLHPHSATQAQSLANHEIEEWILHGCGADKPLLWERSYVETGYDVPDTEVWTLYWTDAAAGETALEILDLQKISSKLSSELGVGLWRESYRAPKIRFETVYSGNDYQPGIAALEGAIQVTHKFTGYWGAARDRFPASAQDEFLPTKPAPVPNFTKDTKNRAISGCNADMLLHIRSGQWWARCSEDEKKAYETNLEPVLRKGMAYLEDNAAESGDFGLRFMRQLVSNRHVQLEERGKSDGRPRLETCSAGFFRSLKDLERWASQHQTHHKIFHGAHAHSAFFGKDTYKMRTWHEVAILKPGEVSFEYVNCEPRTGLLPFVSFEDENTSG